MRNTTKQIKWNGPNTISVHFVYSKKLVRHIRSLSGRYFNHTSQTWIADLSIDNIDKLLALGFVLHKEVKQWYTDNSSWVNIKGLKGVLRPFQGKGVQFINAKGGRALIADEMGLGKTIQVLAWLQQHSELRPVLIIVPASLKLNWKMEIEKWMTNVTVQILHGTKPYKLTGDIIIINYDIIHAWRFVLIKHSIEAVILDEAHYIKNSSSKRTKAVKKICKTIENIVCLTGTPILNRPIELYNIVNLLNPTMFPSRFIYANRYCDAKHNGFGWDFKGASNTSELYKKLSNTIMLRRKKKDVLKELPAKQYSTVPFEIDNRNEYEFAQADFLDYIKQTKGTNAAIKASGAEVLTSIEALKQLAVEGKMKQVIEWIRNFLESGEKLVLFATHRKTINRLMEEFGDIAVKIDGTTNQSTRQQAVEAFQGSDVIRLFVGNIKAAGVGLTLTSSSSVAILEFPWTPGDLHQAIDRVHRIGQESSVNVYYLVAINTIDSKIARLLDSKIQVIDAVLDGGTMNGVTLLQEILEEL